MIYVNLMEGLGGNAILGPGEVLSFSEWGEPAVMLFTPGKGARTKWSVTLSDRKGRPEPRPWLIRRAPDGNLIVVIRFPTRFRAFDLETGRMIWTRSTLRGLDLIRALLPFGPMRRFGY